MEWIETSLFLQVIGWSQTIGTGTFHGPYEFRLDARTSDIEDLVFGAEGWQCLPNMPVHLNLIREQPEKPPKRGIGNLVYNPPAEDMDRFVGGYFWLPEPSYDELWVQAREHRYEDCAVELYFGLVELAGGTFRWNTEKNKVASIISAGVRFERKLKPPTKSDAPPELPKKRGWSS